MAFFFLSVWIEMFESIYENWNKNCGVYIVMLPSPPPDYSLGKLNKNAFSSSMDGSPGNGYNVVGSGRFGDQ